LQKPTNPNRKKTMLIKALLNKVERYKSFVYGSICVMLVDGVEALVIDIEPRRNSGQFVPNAAKGAACTIDSPSVCSRICRSGISSATTAMHRAGSTAPPAASRKRRCPGAMARSGWPSPTRSFWRTGRSGCPGRRPPTSSRPVGIRSSGPSSSSSFMVWPTSYRVARWKD